AGGALGSIVRHAVNILFAHVLERAIPYATAAVNVSGALVIGVLSGLLAIGRIHMSTEMRTFVFVGILGGFTTCSSFHLETFTLAHGGEHAIALGNIGFQTAAGFVAVWAGYRIAVLF